MPVSARVGWRIGPLQAQQFLLLRPDRDWTHTTCLANSARRLVCAPLSAKPFMAWVPSVNKQRRIRR